MRGWFKTIFYNPLAETLLFFYNSMPGGLGVAVILLTLLVKLLLLPVNNKALKSQKKMADLQPKMEKIREEYKDDKEKMAEETMSLYQEVGMNPFSGIILLFIQTPILFALYRVFRTVPAQEGMDAVFLGVDLASPSTLLAIVAGLLFFLQSKLSMSSGGDSKMSVGQSQKVMQYLFPVLIIPILLRVPAAIGLYLIVSSIFSIIQTRVMRED